MAALPTSPTLQPDSGLTVSDVTTSALGGRRLSAYEKYRLKEGQLDPATLGPLDSFTEVDQMYIRAFGQNYAPQLSLAPYVPPSIEGPGGENPYAPLGDLTTQQRLDIQSGRLDPATLTGKWTAASQYHMSTWAPRYSREGGWTGVTTPPDTEVEPSKPYTGTLEQFDTGGWRQYPDPQERLRARAALVAAQDLSDRVIGWGDGEEEDEIPSDVTPSPQAWIDARNRGMEIWDAALYGSTPSQAWANLITSGQGPTMDSEGQITMPRSDFEGWYQTTFLPEVDRIKDRSETTTKVVGPGDFTPWFHEVGADKPGVVDVDLPPDLESEIADLLRPGGPLNTVRTEMARLGLPENLESDILRLLREGGPLSELSGELRKLGVPSRLGDQIVTTLESTRALQSALGGLSLPSSLESGITDLLRPGGPLEHVRTELARLGLPENLESDILGLLREGRPLSDLSMELGKLGIPSQLGDRIAATLGSTVALQGVLNGLSVPADVGQQIRDLLMRGGPIETLQRNLGQLGLPEALEGDISRALGQVGVVGAALEDLRVPVALSLQIYSMIRPGSTLSELSSAVGELRLPEQLSLDIQSNLIAVRSVGAALDVLASTGAVITDELRGLLQDNMRLLVGIPGLGYEEGLVAELRKLQVPASLAGDIASSMIQTRDLLGALRGLNVPPELEESILALQRPGGDLWSLQQSLSDLNVPTELHNQLQARIGQAASLSGALSSLGETGLNVSRSVERALRGNLDLLAGTMHTEGLMEMLKSLKVPDIIASDLANRISQTRVLHDALTGVASTGVEISSDISRALQDNINLLMGAEGEDGLVQALGKLNVPRALGEAIVARMGEAQSLQAALSSLGLPTDLRSDLSIVMDLMGGDLSSETGLTDLLASLRVHPETIRSIEAVQGDLRDLDKILRNSNISADVAGDVKDALAAGQSLDETLRAMRVPDETIQSIQEQVDQIQGLSDNLDNVQEKLSQLQMPEDLGPTLTEIKQKLQGVTEESQLAKEAVGGVTEELAGLETRGRETLAGVSRAARETGEVLGGIEERLLGLESPIIAPDLQRLLSRPQMAELEGAVQSQLRAVIDEMGFDPDEYREAQTGTIENRYNNARTRLGRQFGIDPGGTKSGESQRQFEILESNRIEDLNKLDAEIETRTEQIKQSTLAGLTNALNTISKSTLDQQKLAETTREFDADMRLRLKEFGVSQKHTEALIRQMDSEIINQTRELTATINQRWADLTGNAAGVGEADAEGLGVDLTDVPPYVSAKDLALLPEAQAVREGLQAMTGKEPTQSQVLKILRGEEVKLEGAPTLESRKLASSLVQSNMERSSKYGAIAKEHDLDTNVFLQATTEADRAWDIEIGNVASQFGIGDWEFRAAKMVYDSAVEAGGDPVDAAQIAADGLEVNIGTFQQASDQFDLRYGNALRQTAMNLNIAEDQYVLAQKAANRVDSLQIASLASLFARGRRTKDWFFGTVAPGESVPEDMVDISWAREDLQNLFGDQLRLGPAVDRGRPYAQTPEQAVDALLSAEDSDVLDDLRFAIGARSGAFSTDSAWRGFLVDFLTASREGKPMISQVNFTANDWYKDMPVDEMNTLLQIAGMSPAAQYKPQESPWWESLINGVAQGVGTYLGARG